MQWGPLKTQWPNAWEAMGPSWPSSRHHLSCLAHAGNTHWHLSENCPRILAKSSKYAGAFSPKGINAPPLNGPWPKPFTLLAAFLLIGLSPHWTVTSRHIGIVLISIFWWPNDEIYLVNTYPSFHINLLVANKIHPTTATKGCQTWSLAGGMITWLSPHMEQDRLGHVQLTATCLPEIAGPGPPHIPLSMSWSFTTEVWGRPRPLSQNNVYNAWSYKKNSFYWNTIEILNKKYLQHIKDGLYLL